MHLIHLMVMGAELMIINKYTLQKIKGVAVRQLMSWGSGELIIIVILKIINKGINFAKNKN